MTSPQMRPARPRDPRPARARQLAKAINDIDVILATETLRPADQQRPSYVDLLLETRHRLTREQDR